MIPTIKLNNGVYIPVIGNGPASVGYTPKVKALSDNCLINFVERVFRHFFVMPNVSKKYIDAVTYSFRTGFTLLDNSISYANAPEIKEAIHKSGIRRENLFITTRISNGAQFKGKVKEMFFENLKETGLEYVDLLQFHWPVPEHYLNTWKQMEELYADGFARAIGVANCHQHHLEAIEKVATVVPAVDQFEVHPLFTQKPLIGYCKSKGIQVEAYTPIARMDDRLVHSLLLKGLSKKYKKSVVQIVLRWHIQNGVIPIVRSTNKHRIKENINVFDFELTEEEMKSIDGMNINSRLRYDPDNCEFERL